MSSEGVVILGQNVMVSYVKVYYTPMVSDTYVLMIVHCSLIYKELFCSFVWSGHTLCWSNSMSSLGCAVFVSKMGWY